MKTKFITLLLSILTLLAVSATSSYAVTSVRLQQPGTPTNQDTFNITFVALDTSSSQPVSVQCYKKGPLDAGFVAFHPLINLSNGGNTANCTTDSDVLHGSGTYQFQVIATGTTTVASNIVSINFNNTQRPDTPVNYNKSKPDNCTYKIWFRTANDSGKTVRVVLYRSTDTNFTLDSGHQVNSTNIGSDTDGTMTDNISPNCNTNYYYAIRALDTYGNGSDGIGDYNTTTTVVNPTGTPQTQGAIAAGTGGNVLGSETKAKGEVLGTESAKADKNSVEKTNSVSQNPISASIAWVTTHKKISLLVLIIILAVGYYIYRRFYKKVQ